MTRSLLAVLTAGLLATTILAAEPVPGSKEPPPKEEPPPIKEPPPTKEPIPPPKDIDSPPVAAPCFPAATHTIGLTKLTLLELQTATTLPRWEFRDEVVGIVPGGFVVDYVEERHTITDLELRPHEVDQLVTCLTTEAVKTVDKCTGECRTEYHQVPVVKTVKIVTYETVPVTRDVLVRTPVLKPARDLVEQRLLLLATTIPAIETRFQLLPIQNEITSAPPLPCPAACPNGACPAK